MERRFYRLNEITQISCFTEGDLLDMVEQGKLALCARVEGDSFAAMLRPEPGQSHGLGNLFDYQGMIALPQPEAIKLVNGEPVHLKQVKVLEPDAIKRWRSSRPLAESVPKMTFSFQGDLDAPPKAPFWTFSCVKAIHDLRDIAKGLETLMVSLNEPVKDHTQYVKQATQQRLSPTAMIIKPHQLRFELASVRALYSNLTTAPKPPITMAPVTTHAIKQILERMLRHMPEARSDKLWNQLRIEVGQDGPRYFDVDGVVDEMTRDELSWFGRDRNKLNSLSYARFQNLASEVRKQLKNLLHG